MASIFLRGKIYWILYYQDGRKISYSLKTPDKTVAKFKKNEIENKLHSGSLAPQALRMSCHDLKDEYLKHCKAGQSSNTLSVKRSNLNAFLNEIGNIQISQVNVNVTSRVLDILILDRGYNVTTVNNILKDLKAMLSFAVTMRYLPFHPIKTIKKTKVHKLPPRFLEISEIHAVLKAARGESLEPMIWTAIYTGMRLGELKRLKWKDISFSRNKILVYKSKSKNFRMIPVLPKLRKLLTSLKRDPEDLCFNTANIRRVFKRIARKCGFIKVIDGGERKKELLTIGWHVFRHSYISHLIMGGVDLRTAGELAGHQDTKTTMIYSHLSKSHIEEAALKLPY